MSEAAAQNASDPVLLDVSGHVGTLTLNQPDKRNAMRPELLEDFAKKLGRVKADGSIRVLVIEGSGKTFCSGADFGAMGKMTQQAGSMEEAIAIIYGSFMGVRDLEIPTIAKINGHAIGGGLGLALVCDIRVASTKAKLGVNFTRLGISPGMGTTYILPRLIGLPRAAELFFTGRIFTGEEAERIGLVNYACAPEDLDAKVDALAAEIAGSAPVAVRLTKQALYRHAAYAPGEALGFEAKCQAQTMKMNDAREGILAMMQKRKPTFEGK